MRRPNVPGWLMHEEGKRLATLASGVPRDQAIVELGTHAGLSTCYLASGAAQGKGAHITAVDPWSQARKGVLSDPDKVETGDEVYAAFSEALRSEGHWGRVTPMRTLSTVLSPLWIQPVGLLFIDATHEYEHVRSDYLHWQRHVAPGGWLAFHDYTEDETHPYYGVYQAIRDTVLPTGLWDAPVVTLNLWTARRILTP